MASRSIRAGSLTNEEVGIVRNLLARGDYKNQDILGLINTVRRLDGEVETNGGRISEVKTNKPRYKGIKALSDFDTDAYLAKAAKPASFTTIDTGPLSDIVLAKLFPLNTTHSDRLAITETDVIECKEAFGGKHWVNNCIRAITAFSNNKGGYLAFGIKDKTWEIIGINKAKFDAFIGEIEIQSNPGFGPWSAQIFLLFHLRRPDIFPHGDATLNRAIRLLYGIDPKEKVALDRVVLNWVPYRSVAYLALWRWIDEGMPELTV